MEVFTYNAAVPREQLTSFVHRVQTFCIDNMVVSISAQMIGPSLVLGLTLADDVEVPMANSLTVHVEEIDGHNEQLEDALTAVLERIAEEDSEEDPRVAYDLAAVHRPDLPTKGFVVVSIINGTVVPDDDEGDD